RNSISDSVSGREESWIRRPRLRVRSAGEHGRSERVPGWRGGWCRSYEKDFAYGRSACDFAHKFNARRGIAKCWFAPYYYQTGYLHRLVRPRGSLPYGRPTGVRGLLRCAIVIL